MNQHYTTQFKLLQEKILSIGKSYSFFYSQSKKNNLSSLVNSQHLIIKELESLCSKVLELIPNDKNDAFCIAMTGKTRNKGNSVLRNLPKKKQPYEYMGTLEMNKTNDYGTHQSLAEKKRKSFQLVMKNDKEANEIITAYGNIGSQYNTHNHNENKENIEPLSLTQKHFYPMMSTSNQHSHTYNTKHNKDKKSISSKGSYLNQSLISSPLTAVKMPRSNSMYQIKSTKATTRLLSASYSIINKFKEKAPY